VVTIIILIILKIITIICNMLTVARKREKLLPMKASAPSAWQWRTTL
jgi:hypothetical protein